MFCSTKMKKPHGLMEFRAAVYLNLLKILFQSFLKRGEG